MSACHSSACTGSGFDRVDFECDGEGHRTKITTTPSSGSAVVTTFRYQGDAIAAEYTGGTLTREYTVDPSGTISKVVVPGGQTGAGTYLVTWNDHGDASALYRIETNGTLTLANSYTYSTWGKPTTATHNSIADLGFRFLYVGAGDVQWDSAYGLDLLYMHARHYSPSLGRFLQPDPSRMDAKLFVYTGNGPVSHVDPSGRISVPVKFPRTTLQADAQITCPWCTSDTGLDYVNSYSILYTGPSGTVAKPRTLGVSIWMSTLVLTGSESVILGGTGIRHEVYMYDALVDHTAGVRRATWNLFYLRATCLALLLTGLTISCGPMDGWQRTYLDQGGHTRWTSSSVRHNHRYRIDFWIIAGAVSNGALGGHTGVGVTGLAGAISWPKP